VFEQNTDQFLNFGNQYIWNQNDDYEQAMRNSLEENNYKPTEHRFENNNVLNENKTSRRGEITETIANYYKDLSGNPPKEVDDETREANKVKKNRVIQELIEAAQPLKQYNYSDKAIKETIEQQWGHAFKIFDENMYFHYELNLATKKILEWLSGLLKDLQKNALDNMQIERNTDNCELFRSLRRQEGSNLLNLEQTLEDEKHRYQIQKCKDAHKILFKPKMVNKEQYPYNDYDKYVLRREEFLRKLYEEMTIDQQNVQEYLYVIDFALGLQSLRQV
jgi:hypothetical protein